MRDLRKLIEETRRGKTAFRSRMFNDIVYFFNESPNIHGLPEGMRRKYRFAIAPKRAPAYEDSKEQSEHPTVVPLDRETEMVADQVLPRYLEKQTVLLVQGEPGKEGVGGLNARRGWDQAVQACISLGVHKGVCGCAQVQMAATCDAYSHVPHPCIQRAASPCLAVGICPLGVTR